MERRTPLKRTGPLPFRSKKTARMYRTLRVPLVERLLAERPVCEYPDCRERSTEVHEVKSRARGGSVLDEGNCRCLCHDHHAWITREPDLAIELGLSSHSWD